MEAIALVDGNNFYASCEQSMNPSLKGKPLVVLSNNDGCIIARSSEARALRIKMGVPYFKVKEKLEKEKVVVLSSNYSLYGDISKRLMNLLTKYSEQIEIYSIDEAFLSINRPHDNDLYPWAREIRTSIYQKLGINITVGIGSNKLRSKLANKLAKKIITSSGIFDLEKINNEDEYLKKIKIENIWGIGYQTSKWLQSKGIKNAKELKEMNQYEIKKKLGIVGERIQLELKGYKCLPIEKLKKSKKEIRVSRSFAQSITKLEDLKQALAIYTITAAEKMRLQNLQASTVTIFARTSNYSNFRYHKSSHKKLIGSTNNTIYLLKTVLELSKEIYHPDYKLAKAGVIMQDLTPHNYSQKSIINYPLKCKSERERDLIKAIDFINKRFKSEKITWGITVKKGTWRMNRNLLSGTSTTNINQIPTIII